VTRLATPPVLWAAPPRPFDPLVDDPEERPLEPEAEPDPETEPEDREPDEAPLEELLALEAVPIAAPEDLPEPTDASREAALMTRLRDAFARANGVLPDLDADGRRALDELVRASERLVRSIAGRYANQGVPKDDLYQEGMIGLFRAAKKFDVSLGFRFSTYAMWWIRQAIIQAVHEQGRLIRIPVHAVDQLARTNRVRLELERQGLPAGADAVAAVLLMRPVQVAALWRAARQHVSIENGRGHFFAEDDDQGDLSDVLVAPAAGPDELVQTDDQAAAVGGTLFALSPRERRILRLRFGLEDGQVYSLSVVGLEFGLSRERIRQIEADALAKLRAAHLARRLRPYLTLG
jgi:RNA polymerase sigma factor (sigma-70 family)